jgi:hypothetical protein
MTIESKKAELNEIAKLLKETTGKTYKAESLTVGQYHFLKDIVLTKDLRVVEKTIPEFATINGVVSTTSNLDFGMKFFQATLPTGISVKIKSDLVTNGTLPKGTYKLHGFGGDTRPSFALSDLASYSKVDALFR